MLRVFDVSFGGILLVLSGSKPLGFYCNQCEEATKTGCGQDGRKEEGTALEPDQQGFYNTKCPCLGENVYPSLYYCPEIFLGGARLL